MQPRDRSIQRAELGPDWLDVRDAARELGCTPGQLGDDIRPLITHKSRSLTGANTARAVGYAYARHDLERLKTIMLATGCKPLRAAQLLSLMRSCELRGLVLTELAMTMKAAALRAHGLADSVHAPQLRRRRQ